MAMSFFKARIGHRQWWSRAQGSWRDETLAVNDVKKCIFPIIVKPFKSYFGEEYTCFEATCFPSFEISCAIVQSHKQANPWPAALGGNKLSIGVDKTASQAEWHPWDFAPRILLFLEKKLTPCPPLEIPVPSHLTWLQWFCGDVSWAVQGLPAAMCKQMSERDLLKFVVLLWEIQTKYSLDAKLMTERSAVQAAGDQGRVSEQDAQTSHVGGN